MKCTNGGHLKKLCNEDTCNYCFNRSFASHPKCLLWHPDNNFSPRKVFKQAHHVYKFTCDICLHIFEQNLNHNSNSIGCSYCGNKKLCDSNECIICFNKSFAGHDNAIFWHKDNLVVPRNVFKSSHQLFKFTCNICEHTFEKQLNSIVRGNWCEYCSHTKLCDNNNCMTCFDKSFASCEKIKYWSKLNEIVPRNIFKHTMTLCKFNCSECGHVFEKEPMTIMNGEWCNFCSSKRLCTDLNCQLCFNKSFASHEKSIYWSDENKISPRNLFKCSGTAFKFKCNKCDSLFERQLYRIIAGEWCNVCVNKTEYKLFIWLTGNYQDLIIDKGKKFNWCKNIHFLPFDFLIQEYKLLIELDGDQHFSQVSNWKSPETVRVTDIDKMKKALNNGYSIIRILQEDVYADKNDWKNKLTQYIKLYDTPQVIYLDNHKNKYTLHKTNMVMADIA